MQKINKIQSSYYSIGQLRLDHWTELKNETEELTHCRKGSVNETQHRVKIEKLLGELSIVEQYFAVPSKNIIDKLLSSLAKRDHNVMAHVVKNTAKQLISDIYSGSPYLTKEEEEEAIENELVNDSVIKSNKNYFEVLFLENLNPIDENSLLDKLKELQDPKDQFVYKVTIQRSFQDALIALFFNPNIQAVVVRYAPPYRSDNITELIKPYIQNVLNIKMDNLPESELGPQIGSLIKQFRPELDTYYVTDTALANLKDSTLKTFRRIYYRREDLQELHLAILRGIRERYNTPFFSALKEYSQKPTSVFHAMPISRGNSVFKSKWITDFGDFYGRNMFLAETSSTTGGMDSLLQPTGPLKNHKKWLLMPMAQNVHFL
ncbi:MAG: hypothetical protein Kapaf2KO_17260 [Candidatus Kapaibacteriales bacterium]